MADSSGYTRSLGELRATDAGQFGGKSAGLGELLAAGIAVPAGFALGASAFQEFAAAPRADSPAAIEEAIRTAPLPDSLRQELAQRHDQLAEKIGDPEPPVAVRSSALGEDSEHATYAGQQETFLWRRGVEEICDAVRGCWASLYSPRAISYRAASQLPGDAPPAMGVTIQLMVDAEISGVMFTCNPVTGDPSMVAVNASWGLGQAVVGGEVTPDDFLLSKVTGEVVRQTVNTKAVEYVPDRSGRGMVRAEVDRERRTRPSLVPDQLAALLKLGKRIERHFGCHQDIEWAIDRGLGLIVLQSRPVTGLPERPRQPAASAMSLVMSTFGASAGASEQNDPQRGCR